MKHAATNGNIYTGKNAHTERMEAFHQQHSSARERKYIFVLALVSG